MPIQPSASDGGAVTLLALNSGSSSLKFGVYRATQTSLSLVLEGEVDKPRGGSQAIFQASEAQGRCLVQAEMAPNDTAGALHRIRSLLSAGGAPALSAIGHRLVHGGPHMRQHGLITPEALAAFEAAIPFAPLHLPTALALVRGAAKRFPDLPQVACLDTCFHADMPPVAYTLALPLGLRSEGIQRYGFHGLSCESIVHRLSKPLPGRLIIAHLGNGASITAVRKGISIDTSMGLTPCGGLMMGTRSGDLDPGVIVHLMRTQRMGAADVEALVNHQSGLLGISSVRADMRALHDAAPANPNAQLAIDMFCYRAAKEIGAMATALGGVDQIVFTGGIGEHDHRVRAQVCKQLAGIGVVLDAARNRQAMGVVSRQSSDCTVQVLPSQEDLQIARHTLALCGVSHSWRKASIGSMRAARRAGK